MHIILKMKSWIHISYALLLGIITICGGSNSECPNDISIVTSECLTNYVNKVHHMRRHEHEFYTGVDVEDMRSICQAMEHTLRCEAHVVKDCPQLAGQESEYSAEFIAVYELCNKYRFYEIYSINQYCYGLIKPATRRCHQRFDANTQDYVYGILEGRQEDITSFCSEFGELVQCVWALMYGNCGDQAASLAEALVRPSVPHSNYCNIQQSTTLHLSTVPQPATEDIYKYRESGNGDSENTLNNANNNNNNRNNIGAQNSNDNQIENASMRIVTFSSTFYCFVLAVVVLFSYGDRWYQLT